VNVKYDFSGLNKALAQKVQLSRTPIVDIVQDAAMKVLIGTGTGDGLVQLTRKATVARIKSDLNKPVAGRLGKPSSPRGRTITRPLLFWLALNVLKRTGAGYVPEIVKQTMAAILKMRIASRAYIAAGWLWAARDLHEKSPYLQKKHKLTRLKQRNIPTVDKAARGTAANSFATPVKVSGYTASIVLTNTSRGGDTVGMEFVQQALNNATKDVQVYIDNKVGKEILKQIFQRGGLVVT
jgi:hypothetical protein